MNASERTGFEFVRLSCEMGHAFVVFEAVASQNISCVI
jgi:hypothetical protein